MSLAEMWRVIRRRWYVLLPSILLAMGLTVGVYASIPQQYQSSAMVSLLTSQQAIKGTATVPGTDNPFMNFDSSLNDTADFLVRRLASTDASQQLGAEGVSAYTAVLAASQGPFIQLTAIGSSRADATAAIDKLIAYTGQQLQQLQQQQGVPAQAMIESAVIVPGSPPLAQTKRRTQDTLGAGAGALALAVLGTFALDTLALRRKAARRRRRPGAPSSYDPPSGPPAGTWGPPGPAAGEAPENMRVRRRSSLPGQLSTEITSELISPLPEARD